VLAAALGAEAHSPGLFGQYAAKIRQPPFEFLSPTLTGLLRTGLWTGQGIPPAWPVWVVPLGGIAGLTAWLAWRRPRVEWMEMSWALLPLTLMLAPYAHPHDHALLLIPAVGCLARAFGETETARSRRAAVGLVFGLQAAGFLADALWLDAGWQFFWFPPAMMVAFWLCRRIVREEAGRDV
jgi:hypothetical protein